MKKWIISGIVTVLIWTGGIASIFFVTDSIPRELRLSSQIVELDSAKAADASGTADVKEVIDDSQKRVFTIELGDGSLGSGFLYNNKGDVITNAHVVADAKEVTVLTPDSREMDGTVIGVNPTRDIALVRVNDLKEDDPLPIERERKAAIGDEVLALGSPLGLQNTVTDGIISGVDREVNIDQTYYKNAYQISAPIAPGNSGGPLVDKKTGKVIGINSAAADMGTIGFSIPIIAVLDEIDTWANEAD
ncbi:trypsin-like serine protease [Bacillus mangrovi]|uniref:Trypsin-like serine protease n=1 Tax=Metabacillus mangrovi TaxID=1491830 RepID=A0A7X2V3T6_9BACI|nr:trypsin-like peptidase domain-containing protein [Metabacillus mangrovi]MTH53022.1 trypsin-like serine protease [Metabacillus mangrovi]